MPTGDVSEDGNAGCAECSTKDSVYSWFVALSAFFVQFLTLGFINNVGALNISWIQEFNVTLGEVSWAGSLNYGVVFVSGPVVALLANKIGCQMLAIIGAFIMFFGLVATTFCQTFHSALFCYGVIFGFGVSCEFFSSILILPRYFEKRLASANGFVSAGSGAGTMVLAIFLSNLYNRYGWRASLTYIGFVYIAMVFVTSVFNDISIKMPRCRMNAAKETVNSAISPTPWIYYFWDTTLQLFPVRLFKNVPYLLFNISCFFFMFGYLTPYIHTIAFAVSKGITEKDASLLIGYIAVASLLGKLIGSRVAELPGVNPILMMTVSFCCISVCLVLAPICFQYWHFIIFAVFFGWFDGIYVSLVSYLVGKMVGFDNLGGGVGLLFAVKAVPLTLGSPIAGFLYDATLSYFYPFLVAGILIFVAAIFMFAILFHDAMQWVKVTKNSLTSFRLVEAEEEEDAVHLLPGDGASFVD